MKRSILFVAACMATITVGSAVSATVITFDPYSSTNNSLPSPVSIDGLDFSNDSTQYVWRSNRPGAVNGTNGFIYSSTDLTITKTGGGSFTLGTVDLGQSFYANATDTISYVENLSGGGTATGTLDLTDAFQTFAFNQSIDSIVLGANSGYVVVDNLAYDAVPEPATWSLMIIGLAGLGATLRRRTAAIV